MIEKKERTRSYFLLFCDLLAVAAALPIAHALRRYLGSPAGMLPDLLHSSIFSLSTYLWFDAVSFIIIFIFYSYNVKKGAPHRFRSLLRHGLIVLEEILCIGLAIGFSAFVLKLDVSRALTFIFMVILFLLMAITRLLFVTWFKSRRGSRWYYQRIVVAGNSAEVFDIGDLIAKYRNFGYFLSGFVTDLVPRERIRAPILGRTADFETVLAERVVDEVIFVSSDNGDLKIFERIAMQCEELGIPTRLSLNFFPHAISHTSLDFLENRPFLTFSPVPEHLLSLVFKRIIDVVGALAGILLSLPFYITIPLALKLTSRGRVIYRQTRCGLYGRKFTMYKFRSMVAGADDILWEIKHLNEMNGPVFKMRNDPRITRLGRFLRKTSIDELPQFINVLKGDMSLVGPRAPLPEEVMEYTRWQRRRLSVKPGLTCLWQVSGRSDINFEDWMKLDLKYIDNWSLWLDFKILLRTIPTVLFCRGAR